MASWMVHLRIADALLDNIDGLAEQEFVLGNIAPDSGIPSADWSYYTPSSTVSHFKEDKKDKNSRINIDSFIAQYFTKERRKAYTTEQYSFYLGYLTHLMTDILWADHIFEPCKRSHQREWDEDRAKCIWAMKRDWYDLDFIFIRKHHDFRAFTIYKNLDGIVNTYMDIFPTNAFENRRQAIVDFYMREIEDTELERDYRYLTMERADRFVKESVSEILCQLERV